MSNVETRKLILKYNSTLAVTQFIMKKFMFAAIAMVAFTGISIASTIESELSNF